MGSARLPPVPTLLIPSFFSCRVCVHCVSCSESKSMWMAPVCYQQNSIAIRKSSLCRPQPLGFLVADCTHWLCTHACVRWVHLTADKLLQITQATCGTSIGSHQSWRIAEASIYPIVFLRARTNALCMYVCMFTVLGTNRQNSVRPVKILLLRRKYFDESTTCICFTIIIVKKFRY